MNYKRLILSGIAMFNCIFIPIFSIWGGLFPKDNNYGFGYVMEEVFSGSDHAFDQWVVLFTMAIFVPSLLMLIFAIFNKNLGFKISAVLGLSALLFLFISYIDQYDIDYLLDFDNGSVSIGTWVGFIIFIIAVFTKKTVKIETQPGFTSQQPSEYQGTPNMPTSPENITNIPISTEKKIFCGYCGAELTESTKFCGKCGNKR